MPKIQIDPLTDKVMFDSATGKVQMVGAPCDQCPPNTTPMRIKVTMSGLLVCQNLGGCCGDQYQKVISQGDEPWDFETELTPGRLSWTGCGGNCNMPCWSPYAFNPCFWCAFKSGNFGAWERYNLEGCLGGLYGEGTSYFCRRSIQLSRGITYYRLELFYTCQPVIGVVTQCRLFYYDGPESEIGPNECFPYGKELINQVTCDGSGVYPYSCIGNGKAVLTFLE